MDGEEIQLHKVTRSEMGAYMCIATNGVPPAVGKTVQLNVNCKYLDGISYFTLNLIKLTLRYTGLAIMATPEAFMLWYLLD